MSNEEANVEQQLKRIRAAQEELQAAEQELGKLGRFQGATRSILEKRLEQKDGRK